MRALVCNLLKRYAKLYRFWTEAMGTILSARSMCSLVPFDKATKRVSSSFRSSVRVSTEASKDTTEPEYAITRASGGTSAMMLV